MLHLPAPDTSTSSSVQLPAHFSATHTAHTSNRDVDQMCISNHTYHLPPKPQHARKPLTVDRCHCTRDIWPSYPGPGTHSLTFISNPSPPSLQSSMHRVQIGLFSCSPHRPTSLPQTLPFFKHSALANTSMSHASEQLDFAYAKEKRNVSYVPVPFHVHSPVTHPWP
jgi:hypothetical protein